MNRLLHSIYTFTQPEFCQILTKMSLSHSDFNTVLVEKGYVLYERDKPVAFQCINTDNLCTMIYVLPSFRGKGLSYYLLNASGCYYPTPSAAAGNISYWRAIADSQKFWAELIRYFHGE